MHTLKSSFRLRSHWHPKLKPAINGIRMRITHPPSPRRKSDAAVKNSCRETFCFALPSNRQRTNHTSRRFQLQEASTDPKSQTQEYSSWCQIQFIMYSTLQGIAYGAANREARFAGRGPSFLHRHRFPPTLWRRRSNACRWLPFPPREFGGQAISIRLGCRTERKA